MDVIVYKKGMEIPDRDCILVAQGGAYRVRCTAGYKSVCLARECFGLDELEPSFSLRQPKLTPGLLNLVVGFFKWVYEEHYSEAIVLLAMDRAGKYQVICPKQKVSGGSVTHSLSDKDVEWMESSGFTVVGDIHSHANLQAYSSSVDEKDELNSHGLHIIFGGFAAKVPSGLSVHAVYALDDHQFELAPSLWRAGPPTAFGDFPEKWKKLVKKESFVRTFFKGSRWYDNDDKEWLPQSREIPSTEDPANWDICANCGGDIYLAGTTWRWNPTVHEDLARKGESRYCGICMREYNSKPEPIGAARACPACNKKTTVFHIMTIPSKGLNSPTGVCQACMSEEVARRR